MGAFRNDEKNIKWKKWFIEKTYSPNNVQAMEGDLRMFGRISRLSHSEKRRGQPCLTNLPVSNSPVNSIITQLSLNILGPLIGEAFSKTKKRTSYNYRQQTLKLLAASVQQIYSNPFHLPSLKKKHLKKGMTMLNQKYNKMYF